MGIDEALGFAHQVYESSQDAPDVPEFGMIERGAQFPPTARRACLVLNRPPSTVAALCATGRIGFDLADGKGPSGVDTAAGPAVVLY